MIILHSTDSLTLATSSYWTTIPHVMKTSTAQTARYSALASECRCDSGFHMEFPMLGPDDCEGDGCGENQTCVDDDLNNRTCSCVQNPGLLTVCLQSALQEKCLPVIVTIPFLLTAILLVATVLVVLVRKRAAAKAKPLGLVNQPLVLANEPHGLVNPELNYVVVDVNVSLRSL